MSKENNRPSDDGVKPTENSTLSNSPKVKTLGYVGPDYPSGTLLNAYGRTIDPKSWTKEEYDFWIGVEPRYGEYFE